MDAAYDALERKKLELLAQVADLELQQQRQRGLFKKVPHFGEIEDAGRSLGQTLSRFTQTRMANEVAATESTTKPCPTCGRECRVEVVARTVTGLDGPTEILEPKADCPVCRRAFFPSA